MLRLLVIMFIGIGISVHTKGGVVYTPEAIALFARLIVEPPSAVKDLIDKLIVDYKTCGYWDLSDVIVRFNLCDAQGGLLNLKGDSCNASAVNTPTFTKYYGYEGNASTKYINTNYTPSVNGVKMLKDNAHFYEDIYIQDVIAGAKCDGGGNGTVGTIFPTNNDALYIQYNRVNSSAFANFGNLSAGSFFMSRSVSTHIERWLEGIKSTGVCVSASLTSRPLYIFGCTWHATSSNPQYLNKSKLRGYSLGAYCNDTIKEAVKVANDYFNTNIIGLIP